MVMTAGGNNSHCDFSFEHPVIKSTFFRLKPFTFVAC